MRMRPFYALFMLSLYLMIASCTTRSSEEPESTGAEAATENVDDGSKSIDATATPVEDTADVKDTVVTAGADEAADAPDTPTNMVASAATTASTTKTETAAVEEKPVEQPVKPEASEPVEIIPPPEPTKEEIYTSISSSVVVGDVETAIEKFEDAFSEDPESSDSKVLYSGLQMAAGKIDEARETLEDVLAEDDENTNALFNLALIEEVSGNEGAQTELLEKIVSADPVEARAHAGLGEIALANGRIDEAIGHFSRAIEIDPENIVARVGYGNALTKLSRHDEALVQFDMAIEIDSSYAFAYIDRSRAKLELEDFAGAEKDLSSAIELSPDYYWNYIDRGRIRLHGIYDYSGALEDFERAIAIDPEYFYPYIYRAAIFDKMDRRAEAISDYERVLDARPDYYYAYEPLGILNYLEGRWLDAVPYLKKSYELQPEDHAYPLLVALSYLRAGKTDASEAYLEDTMGRIPRDLLAYHLARLLIEPGYDGYVATLISREADKEMKIRMLYYFAAYYLLEERTSLAQTYLLEVEDEGHPGMIEYRLAVFELEPFRE